MADDVQNNTDRHNISKQGDKYVAVVTRHFDDMDRALQWAESTYVRKVDEKPASETSTGYAEQENANVNPAPIPAGAEQVVSGGTTENDGSTQGAPTPQDAAKAVEVSNVGAGTHDPDLNTTTTQVPVNEAPAPSSK